MNIMYYFYMYLESHYRRRHPTNTLMNNSCHAPS